MVFVRWVLAVAVIVVIITMTPILDILEIFATIVLIPVLLLVAMKIVSEDTYNILRGNIPGMIDQLREKIAIYREHLEYPDGKPNVAV